MIIKNIIKNLILPDLIIFYNSKKQLLLQERGHYSKRGEKWAFFWWGIKEWETALEAFIREWKEELNLDMTKFDYNYIWEYIYDFRDKIAHRNIFIIKTDLEESDFTVYEWISAKYFSRAEVLTKEFMSPVWPILDIIKKYIV